MNFKTAAPNYESLEENVSFEPVLECTFKKVL